MADKSSSGVVFLLTFDPDKFLFVYPLTLGILQNAKGHLFWVKVKWGIFTNFVKKNKSEIGLFQAKNYWF